MVQWSSPSGFTLWMIQSKPQPANNQFRAWPFCFDNPHWPNGTLRVPGLGRTNVGLLYFREDIATVTAVRTNSCFSAGLQD